VRHDGVDLVAAMDDATSEVYSAFLVEEEGTATSFRVRRIGRNMLDPKLRQRARPTWASRSLRQPPPACGRP